MDESINKKYLQLAEKLRISQDDEFIEPQVALKQKNLKSDGFTTIGTLGNFSVVIGKAKSRKSFYIIAVASAVLSNDLILGKYKGEFPKEQCNVVYIDTEQGKYNVQLAQKRIGKLTKKEKLENLYLYHLRALKPSERLKVIEAVIYATKNIGYVIIDGVRDLVTSINDEEQATNISSMLLKWSEELNIHIIVVLHQNKGNDYARGHLGTELMNKAELVLSVTKQNGNEEISIVKPEYSRGIEPEPFAFTIVDGLPSAVENFVEKTANNIHQKKLKDLIDEDKNKLLKEVFSDEKGFKYK
jgi:predicted ATP-dependent serine protease